MVSKNDLKRWLLKPVLLSVFFLVLLSLAGGPLAISLFLPDPGGFYWPFYLSSVVCVFAGPFSVFVAYFIGMIDWNFIEMLPSFFIGVGIIGWWILCINKVSFFFLLPILFWVLIGAFWFVMLAGISV